MYLTSEITRPDLEAYYHQQDLRRDYPQQDLRRDYRQQDLRQGFSGSIAATPFYPPSQVLHILEKKIDVLFPYSTPY